MQEENLVIHKIFSEVAKEFPENIALQIKKGEQWIRFSYRDLELSSLKVASFLIKEGFKKGDFAAIILENRPEWPVIYLGIMRAGLIAVPLDPALQELEIKSLIADSGAKVIFCSREVFMNKISAKNIGGSATTCGGKQVIQDNLTKLVILDVKEPGAGNLINFSDIESVSPLGYNLPQVSSEDIASLIYTSGTTGKPKGVLLSHKNISSNAKNLQKLNLCFSSDNVLSILPLYHTYAFMVTLILPLFSGAKVIYFYSFKSQDLTRVIPEAGVTILVGVPQLFLMLHKAIFEKIKKIPFYLRLFFLPFIKFRLHRHFGSLRFLVSGGARLEPKVASDLSRLLGIKLVEGYGLTETSPVVTLNPPQKIKFGSVGRPIPEVKIKILNPDESGIGEVLIQGPNVMQGYFRRPDLTAQVIKEGWFYSGDLGFIDKDGYLYLTGREKEVIVLSSGKNIYPEELEEYFNKSPYIKEICILSRQEEKFGSLTESLYAIIVPNLEYFQQKNETDIRGKLRWELENLAKNLPTYKHIMGFTVTKEELPRTVLKKIKRYQVREKYLAGALPQEKIQGVSFSKKDLGILNKEITKKVIGYISKEINRQVYLDNHLEIDLGIDSLTKVELGLGLESLLKIKIPDTLLYSAYTVKDIIVNIQDLLEGAGGVSLKTDGMQKSWSQVLREAPAELILKRIRIDVGFFDILVTPFFKSALLFIFRIFWQLKIKGREFLPDIGPYMLCPNHASYLDGFAVFSSLNFQAAINTFFIGYTDIFEHPSVGWTNKLARLIPIDPSTHLTEAMQAVSFVLSQKKIVCIFPEGRRSIDDNVAEFKKGVGILIKELNVPVVPVYIQGSHQSWPRGNLLPRPHPLRVTFGKPILAAELLRDKEQGRLDDYEALAKALREEVLKLY